MAELLEVLHLPDHDRVAEVNVGRGRIETDLDRERLAAAELRFQIGAIRGPDKRPQMRERAQQRAALCGNWFEARGRMRRVHEFWNRSNVAQHI